MKVLPILLCLGALGINLLNLKAQEKELYQNIRGEVVDRDTRQPLIGAAVFLKEAPQKHAGTTDADGRFLLEKVPVGLYTIVVRYMGYETYLQPNLRLTSGKEVQLEIGLQEQVMTAQEVEITDREEKGKVANEFATVSARTFNIEEAERFAGSRNDPARMAANYAGVSAANDARNDIIIRGNSPTGLLWRLEGIDIPNPNHFSAFGTTGGPVSMLNHNVLRGADFLTGAFSAQYGNSVAGAFDLQMRNGNRHEREYLGQIGFNGFELGAEGPFKKGGKATYLANYRYSTLGVFNALGLDLGTGAAVPYYQDASFKVDLPTENAGRFQIFGVGGISNIHFENDELNDQDNLFAGEFNNIQNGSKTGIFGVNNIHYFNDKAYGKATLALTSTQSTNKIDTLIRDENLNVTDKYLSYENIFTQTKASFNYDFHYKPNAKNKLNAGLFVDQYFISFLDSAARHDPEGNYDVFRDFSGETRLYRAYAQWRHRFSERLSFNAGLHFQYFALNESFNAEPRLGLQYAWAGNQINFGFGSHSQLQPLQYYFIESRRADGSSFLSNKNLDFTRSLHWVLGYEKAFSRSWRMKTEVYYQYLTDVPVETLPSHFSMLNAGADFSFPVRENLVNEGLGQNYGIEATLERFFDGNYYALVTASIFESTYEGSDGVERNTAFNGNFNFNLLGGKEWEINPKYSISFDLNNTFAGGRRYIPIDVAASMEQGQTVLIEDQAYESRLKDYFRMDVQLTLRKNSPKFAQEWAIDIQNVTNRENVFVQDFNPVRGRLENIYQTGIFPVMQYRILF